MDEEILTRSWRWIALRGVVALVFGVLAFINPGVTLHVLVLFFGAFVLVDGLFAVVAAIARRGERHWVSMLIGGLFSIAAGVITLVMPAITATALLILIAVWAVLLGLSEIVAAIRLRKVIRGEWLLALAGVLAVALGVLLIAFPMAGMLAAVLWIAAWAVVSGVLLLALAFRLRRWGLEHLTGPTPRPA